MAHQDLKATGTTTDKPALNIEKDLPASKGPEQAPRNLPPGHPDSPGHQSKSAGPGQTNAPTTKH